MAIKIYKAVQTTILILILAVVAALFSMVTFLDINPYVVVSGSMEPKLPVGSLCLVDTGKVTPETGDIISYQAGEAVVTHRVIKVTKDGYVTKGDSNNAVDPGIVKSKQVVGTCIACIPKAGYAVMFFRSAMGIVLELTFVICFCLLGKLLEGRKEVTDKENE